MNELPTSKSFIDGMSPEDSQRYIQWHKYAKAGIEPVDRLRLMDWDRPPGPDLYLKNKRVYDNPKYFDPKTGNEYWPGQNGDPNLDGFLNGEFKNTKLQSGKKIDRFGSNYGSFFGW
ncbi:hypothetical protein [Streptococcus equi]|uniref:hypothetical protein n=1 Tax=Streptococcus equi TaxID=1336 RepID=UPI0005C2E637|nr:hypothetical protein [Streptococcus equi]KIS09064.1 membrane protein [Streptococcus equi subsp. zooepidemicus Sz5]